MMGSAFAAECRIIGNVKRPGEAGSQRLGALADGKVVSSGLVNVVQQEPPVCSQILDALDAVE